MTATAIATAAPSSGRVRPNAFSGLLLAAGSVALFVGTLFYARLTPQLGLPALPGEREQAFADALSAGAQKLALAGGWAFLGDCLMLAASIALVRRRDQGSDLEAAGWALIGVSAAIAMMFDPMMASLFWPLAHGSEPAPFLAVKSWFDLLFAAADVSFGLGCFAVLWADARSGAPLLVAPLRYCGAVVCVAAAVSGLGEITGLLHWPLVIGLTVSFGCVVLAALGVRIARAA
jgi:hypothetical protein